MAGSQHEEPSSKAIVYELASGSVVDERLLAERLKAPATTEAEDDPMAVSVPINIKELRALGGKACGLPSSDDTAA